MEHKNGEEDRRVAQHCVPSQMEMIERRSSTGCTAGHPRQMNRTNKLFAPCTTTHTTTPSIIKYLDDGGEHRRQLSGHALDHRGRDAVEAEGGHLSVSLCGRSGGGGWGESMMMTRSRGKREDSRQGTKKCSG